VMALQFIYKTLTHDLAANRAATEGVVDPKARKGIPARPRRMRFITSVDPLALSVALQGLEPGSTIVVQISIRGNEETSATMNILKNWLLQNLTSVKRPESVINHHVFLVTGMERLVVGSKPSTTFLIPDHSRCEPFTTFTAATLLPLSIIFGWPIVEEILAGAHDMDTHFVETSPRYNIPVLLALVDIWNEAFLRSSGRVVTPFFQGIAAFPTFVSTLESQVCGNASSSGGQMLQVAGRGEHDFSCSGIVIDGGLNGTFDRAMYQGGRALPCEIVMAMDTQVSFITSAILGAEGIEDGMASQDTLMCSCFAHADTMAFGAPRQNWSMGGIPASESSTALRRTFSSFSEVDDTDGNRPSTLLICGKCTAFTCGQLIAMSEHRAIITARLWDIDPFPKSVGSALRMERTAQLKDDLLKVYNELADPAEEGAEENSHLSVSTFTILNHYANMMREQNHTHR